MNVIKLANTSGFCYKAVLRPLAACAQPFALSSEGFGVESSESGTSYQQHNVSLCHVAPFPVYRNSPVRRPFKRSAVRDSAFIRAQFGKKK